MSIHTFIRLDYSLQHINAKNIVALIAKGTKTTENKLHNTAGKETLMKQSMWKFGLRDEQGYVNFLLQMNDLSKQFIA